MQGYLFIFRIFRITFPISWDFFSLSIYYIAGSGSKPINCNCVLWSFSVSCNESYSAIFVNIYPVSKNKMWNCELWFLQFSHWPKHMWVGGNGIGIGPAIYWRGNRQKWGGLSRCKENGLLSLLIWGLCNSLQKKWCLPGYSSEKCKLKWGEIHMSWQVWSSNWRRQYCEIVAVGRMSSISLVASITLLSDGYHPY